MWFLYNDFAGTTAGAFFWVCMVAALRAGLSPQIKQTNKKGHRTRSHQNTSLCTASAHVYRTTGHILLKILDTAFKNFCQQEFTWWTRIQILVSLESIEPEVRYVLNYMYLLWLVFFISKQLLKIQTDKVLFISRCSKIGKKKVMAIICLRTEVRGDFNIHGMLKLPLTAVLNKWLPSLFLPILLQRKMKSSWRIWIF